ncbi:uncharacterized protein ABDE67_012610 [Symphorus nematophorus]
MIQLFLIVLLSTFDLSKGGCKDYFTTDILKGNLTDTFSFVKTKDPKDIMECAVEKAFLQGIEINTINTISFLRCFENRRYEKPVKTSEKCKGIGTTYTVTFYQFMCLITKALNLTAEDIGHKGCEYETVCKINSDIVSTDFGQTTTLSPTTTALVATLPPTTLSEKTTAPTTALSPTTQPERTTTTTTTTALSPTTQPERTTTTTTALSPTTQPERTTTALSPTTLTERTTTTALSPTTLQERTTTTVLPSTTTATTATQSPVSGQTSQIKDEQEKINTTVISRTLLSISLSLNVVLLLAFYLYMRRERFQDCSIPTKPDGVIGEPQPMTEMELNSWPATGNESIVETSYLMQA